MTKATLDRLVAGIPALVGAGALATPSKLVALYGADPAQMTGIGAFGWRLFAIRNLMVGGLAARDPDAWRTFILATQLPDQLVFAHAFRTRSIPRPTAALAMASSGAVVALCLAARRA